MQEQESIILRPKFAAQYLNIGRSSLYEKTNAQSIYYDASFPKPIRLGKRSVGFLRAELEAWILAPRA